MAKVNFTRRGSILYIRKRVPLRFKSIEPREFVMISLHTDSEIIAQGKAAAAWNEMLLAWEAKLEGKSDDAAKRFAAAKNLADRRGFAFAPAAEVAKLPLDELVARIEAALKPGGASIDRIEAAAVLGGAKPPKLMISQVLDEYWTLAKEKTLRKSKDQVRRWENPRKKAFANFLSVVGDKAIEELTTKDMNLFRGWWIDRMEEGEVGANSANKDMTHFVATLRTVATASDINLNFNSTKLHIKEGRQKTRPPFSTKWIKDKLLAPGALDGMNQEARAILLGMVNTGYRPSEGAMLTAAQIRLEANIPHLKIEEVGGRQLKTEHSERVIPLVGVSLEAFRAFRDGFPRYADKAGLSGTVNKFLRENGLLETEEHSLYSLRHSFEDRLLEAKVDERVRRDLMGHTLQRERYGAGGSLEFLHGEVQKIAL